MFIRRPRLALLLSSLILIIGLGLALDAYFFAQTELTRQMRRQGQGVGDDLHQILRRGMSANDHEGIRQAVADAVGQGDVVQVRILGLADRLYADSSGGVLGTNLDKGLPGCAECHRQNPLPVAAVFPFWPDRLRIATPIENESTCMSCHNIPGATSLGVILVDVSLSRGRIAVEDRLWQQLSITGGIAIVVGLLVGGRPRWGGWSLAPAMARFGRWGRSQARLLWLVGGVAGGIVFVTLSGSAAATTLEQNDAFCASCHTEPETIYYQRSLVEPVDLASAHAAAQVACIDCHSGVGVAGRLEAMALGGKNLFRFVAGHYETATQTKAAMGVDHCQKCHGEIGASPYQPATHYHYFGRHLTEMNACVTCHAGHQIGGAAASQYIDEANLPQQCERCHQQLR